MDSENQIRYSKHEDNEYDNNEKYNPKFHMPHMYPGQMHCPYMNMCGCPFMQGKMYNPMDMDMDDEDEDMRQRPRPHYYHRPRPHYYPRPHIRPYFYPFLFPYYYDEYEDDHDYYDEWDEY